MTIVLRCTEGPCAGETITIDSELVLGRGESDPGRLGGDVRLSRRHARLFVDEHGRPLIEDLGSTNGTWVNEQRLTEPHVCGNGDVLRVGQTTFEVDVPTVAPATELDAPLPAFTPTIADAPPPSPRLRVLAGPKEGEEIPVVDELLIGRSFGEPGALGGDRQLSRRHARIVRGPGGVFFIADTGSSNGTIVNGAPLTRARPLNDGDKIAVGASILEAHGMPSAPMAVELDREPAAAPVFASAPPPPLAPPPGPPPIMPAAELRPPPQAPHAAHHLPHVAHFVPQGAAHARLSSHRGRVIGLFAAVFLAAVGVAVAVVVIAAPPGSRACPSGFVCHPPPTAPPLVASTTFTGSLGWRLEYDPTLAMTTLASPGANALTLVETAQYDRDIGAPPGSNSIAVLVRAFSSSQVSAQTAMQELAGGLKGKLVGTVTAPSSDQMFGVPVLGYHPAIGEVLEGNTQTPQGPGALEKIAIMAASSGGVTVAFGTIYPIQRGQNQADNPDRPYDEFGDQILGTLRFPSDGVT